MSDAALSTLVLLATLALFVSEKVRHDLVALIALAACLILGLVPASEALVGFSDPAVVAVASVLVVGRAVELSGVAAGIARVAIPARASFTFRMLALLSVGAFLSAFMNNIAALVITMPLATEIARSARRPVGVILMPLAFATILGGMTTLIGTPANLILSSMREQELGAPFGFFTMAPVGIAVTVVGVAYLGLVGWRLLPVRMSAVQQARPPWRVFELAVPEECDGVTLADDLRSAKARILAHYREGVMLTGDRPSPGDHLLVISRSNQWTVAEATGLSALAPVSQRADWSTARVVVGHGSFLIGQGYEAVTTQTNGQLSVVAAGPRAARMRVPMAQMRIEAGDQLFLRGASEDIANFLPSARLLEVDRLDRVPVDRRRAAATLAIFAAAIMAIIFGGISPALAFLGAAGALALTRLIPADETYRSIDWSVIVLLGAMIPVGQSFETSGAAAVAAGMLGDALAQAPLFLILAAICTATLLLSIFLNNVATAIIMGPLAIEVAGLLGVAPNAALLAVLVGTSSDFLTPIGHQNNLLVMGPGGYRFTDYARMGAPLVVGVVITASAVLTWAYT